MIEIFNLADLRRAVARKPIAWPAFTIGDLYPGRVIGQLSKRTRRRNFREWLERRYYTASDTLAYVGGTVWTWQDSTGTNAMTLQNLSSGSGRQGVKSATTIVAPPNGGTNAVPPDFFSVQLQATFGTAATAGGEVQVYVGFSPSATAGTSNPASLTGTDAAGPNSDTYPQLTFCGSLIASNNLSTNLQWQTPFAIVNTDPTNSPYVCPLVVNTSGTGQSLKNTANTSILTWVPYWRQRAA